MLAGKHFFTGRLSGASGVAYAELKLLREHSLSLHFSRANSILTCRSRIPGRGAPQRFVTFSQSVLMGAPRSGKDVRFSSSITASLSRDFS